VDAGVVATDDQSQVAMFRVAGRYFETADHDEMDAAHKRLNVLARNIASDRLILSVHLVRRAASADDYPAGTFRSAFARRLDEAYRGSVLRQLYRNDMFLSVVRLPPAVAGDRLTSWWSRKRKAQAETPAEARQHLEEICRILQADLAAYGLTRLGVRHEGRVAYSEIGEALSLILTGSRRGSPITGRLGARFMPIAPFSAGRLFGSTAMAIRASPLNWAARISVGDLARAVQSPPVRAVFSA
jgi:type IV secretion system protein VirB4